MNESVANGIIVEAKNQYTRQLTDIVSPCIYSGLRVIFDNCKTSQKCLKKFQEKLCTISKWNQEIIDNEYDKLISTSKCVWLDKLIETVFVCNVKILTTINSNQQNTFNIKVPDTKNFIHKCYIETARQLYIEPHLMDDREEFLKPSVVNKNYKNCMEIIEKSIIKTLHSFIPKQEIVEKCLANYTGSSEGSEGSNDTEGVEGAEGDDITSTKSGESDENWETEDFDGDKASESGSDNPLLDEPNDIFMKEPEHIERTSLDIVDGKNIDEATQDNEGNEGNEVKKISVNEDVNFFSDED